MIITRKSNYYTSFIYLLVYSFISLILILFLIKRNIKNLNLNYRKIENKLIIILMLSIAGIPPLLGFLPK
jgi:NADH:ubiquinone oxidoreductase subunit 2 (subunit N)